MDADEFYDWIAYDMLRDKKFKDKIDKQIAAEYTADEHAQAIKQMFESIRGK